MEGSYNSIDSILAEDTLVPVTCTKRIDGVGKTFDPGSNVEDLQSGSRVEMPLWLSKPLAEHQVVKFRRPPAFGEKMQRQIHAGAEVVDLKQRCPAYYEVARQLAVAARDESLADFLLLAFRERYKALLTQALSTTERRTAAIRRRLSEEERVLYEAGQHAMARFEAWRKTGSSFERPLGNGSQSQRSQKSQMSHES